MKKVLDGLIKDLLSGAITPNITPNNIGPAKKPDGSDYEPGDDYPIIPPKNGPLKDDYEDDHDNDPKTKPIAIPHPFPEPHDPATDGPVVGGTGGVQRPTTPVVDNPNPTTGTGTGTTTSPGATTTTTTNNQ